MTKTWRQSATHRNWLETEAHALFEFFQFSAINPNGGFFPLDDEGRPAGPDLQWHPGCSLAL